MDANNTETDAKTPAKFIPLAHLASLLGLVAIAGTNELYKNGSGQNLSTSTAPRMIGTALGAALAYLFVGALVATIMGKRKTYPLIYGIAFIAAFIPILASL